MLGNLRDATLGTSIMVDDFIDGIVLRVDGADQHVVGDVFQVATELKPWSGGRNVIGGTLALNLDEDAQVLEVAAVPFGKGGQELQTIGLGVNVNCYVRTVRWRMLVGIFTGIKSLSREFITIRRFKQKFLAISTLELLGPGVKVQGASQRENNGHFG